MSIEQAIMFAKQVRDGCTSGKFSEWPQLRRSCGELVAEIARLRQELEGGEVRQLLCLAKIRGAVGDDEGRLMGDELVKRIARLESDKSNLENMYKQQARDYRDHIAGLEAENTRLRETVEKLPVYENTGERFVPGRDDCWGVLDNGTSVDLSNRTWAFLPEDEEVLEDENYNQIGTITVHEQWVAVLPAEFCEEADVLCSGPFCSTRAAAEAAAKTGDGDE